MRITAGVDSNSQRAAFAASVLLLAGSFAAPPGIDLAVRLAAALAFCAGFILRDPRQGTFWTALVAAGCNAYLFARKLDSAGDSACNVNEVINCDVVNQSAASEMFGVPITLFGLGFYAGLMLAAMFHKSSTPRLFQVSGLFAVLNLIYSAWLAYQASLIGAVCFVCITIYAANALLLWAALEGLKKNEERLRPAPALLTSWTTLIISGTFAVVVIGGAGQWNQVKAKDPAQAIKKAQQSDAPVELDANMLAQLYMQPANPVELDGSEHVLGDPNAPYLLVEWADYGCPHCAIAASELPQLVKEMPNIQVRFKAFPLSGPCNPAMQSDGDPRRCQAAAAVECAGDQAKFWDLQHLVFANQQNLEDDDLAFMANQVGLDMDAWKACMAGPEVWEGIKSDSLAGVKAGVQGTPSMFLKGTHGDDFIMLNAGVAGAYALIQTHMSGTPLPPAGPYQGR